jgi:hypothetical protein
VRYHAGILARTGRRLPPRRPDGQRYAPTSHHKLLAGPQNGGEPVPRTDERVLPVHHLIGLRGAVHPLAGGMVSGGCDGENKSSSEYLRVFSHDGRRLQRGITADLSSASGGFPRTRIEDP